MKMKFLPFLHLNEIIMDCKYRDTFHQYSLEHGGFEYKDLADTWRDLERKAQGNIAITGIFLTGASLMYRTSLHPSDTLKYLFFISILFLAISALCALIVLFVSEMESIEGLKKIRRDIEHMRHVCPTGIPEDRYRQFISTRVSGWIKVNEGLHKENNRKAQWLSYAQHILILAIISVSATIFLAALN